MEQSPAQFGGLSVRTLENRNRAAPERRNVHDAKSGQAVPCPHFAPSLCHRYYGVRLEVDAEAELQRARRAQGKDTGAQTDEIRATRAFCRISRAASLIMGRSAIEEAGRAVQDAAKRQTGRIEVLVIEEIVDVDLR